MPDSFLWSWVSHSPCLLWTRASGITALPEPPNQFISGLQEASKVRHSSHSRYAASSVTFNLLLFRCVFIQKVPCLDIAVGLVKVLVSLLVEGHRDKRHLGDSCREEQQRN